jgi:2-oxo-hept-3-ene-1,7-dioate hydratase
LSSADARSGRSASICAGLVASSIAIRKIEETGVAAGVLGHPALGVAWLANKLGQLGVTLEPGHLVLAGSFTRAVHAKKGDTLHADFGALGGIALQFV